MSVVRVSCLAFTIVSLTTACSFDASGVGPGGDANTAFDAPTAVDGPPHPDARPMVDVAQTIDAPVIVTIDAPPPPPPIDAAHAIDAMPTPIDAALPIDAAPTPPDAPPPPPPIDAAPPPPPDAMPPPPPVCGNGVINAGEQCDDGNTTAGDGCSATCQWEPGACGPGETLTALTPGTIVSGSTSGAPNDLTSASCGGAAAGEKVYTITIGALSDLTVSTAFMGTGFHTVEYVRTTCNSAATELGCDNGGTGFGTTGSAMPLTDVPPGTYFVIVDGYAGASGAFQLEVTVTPIVPLGAMCDPTMMANRCADGSSCVTGGGGSTCVSSTLACEASATPLTMDPLVTLAGTTSGASGYAPTCGGATPTGGEDWFSATVPPGPAQDLVVELDATASDGYNPIVDLDSTCGATASSLSCGNVSATPMRQEIAVAPAAAAGTYYVAADGANGTAGAYTISAWTRALVGLGAACDRDVVTSRCTSGYCVDVDNDGTATCSTLMPLVDMAGNTNPCTTPDGPEHDDFAYEASISGTGDVDVVRIVPTVTSSIVATIVGPNGGCAVDTRLALLGGNCFATTTLATSDNEGLGACPRLDTVGSVTLTAGTTYWLSISRHPTAGGTGAYTMTVDFIP